jgi:hypothetical protein
MPDAVLCVFLPLGIATLKITLNYQKRKNRKTEKSQKAN